MKKKYFRSLKCIQICDVVHYRFSWTVQYKPITNYCHTFDF